MKNKSRNSRTNLNSKQTNEVLQIFFFDTRKKFGEEEEEDSDGVNGKEKKMRQFYLQFLFLEVL